MAGARETFEVNDRSGEYAAEPLRVVLRRLQAQAMLFLDFFKPAHFSPVIFASCESLLA